MQSKKAIMTSRREFVSNALGIALVSASTWPIRGDNARSMDGQSDSSTSNSGNTTLKRSLRWDVFLTLSIPAIAIDLTPGEKERPWPPISSTLISGERDAVLVDTPISVEQARALANWIGASGKNLTTIYATHGHGDHFFGTSTVLERFPDARFVAQPEVIKVMRQQASPESLRIWVQLGCNKSSRGFLRAPSVAIGAVKLQPVTSGRWTVTAEAAGLPDVMYPRC